MKNATLEMENKAAEVAAQTEGYIPSDDEVTAVSSGKAWHFANGKIVRGAEDPPRSGNYEEERPKIVGRLMRVGIFQGVPKDGGFPYTQVEADIQTKDGLVHLKSNVTSSDDGSIKPTVATLKFAWGLTQIKKGDLILITTTRGEPISLPGGGKGGCPTYVNFARVDANNRATNIYSPKRDPKAPRLSAAEQWAELDPQLRFGHDAYEERTASSDDEGDTHFGLLCKECEAKGWPTPEQAPAEWLAMVAKARNEPARAKLTDYTDDDWGSVRQTVQPITGMLPALKAVAERLAAKAAPAAPAGNLDAAAFGAEEHDPFKDE